jgi:hypothetical protein
MYILQLNPITSNAEHVVPVARAETREELLALLQREKVEPYREPADSHRWYKVYRKGGPLEWYNDPGPMMQPWIGVDAILDIGTRDDWARSAAERYDRAVFEIPEVRYL